MGKVICDEITSSEAGRLISFDSSYKTPKGMNGRYAVVL